MHKLNIDPGHIWLLLVAMLLEIKTTKEAY